MRRKNSTTKSNSEKKIEELYRQALRSVKEGRLLQKQPDEPAPVIINKNKNTINAQLALDQALQRQVERRKQRKVLSVQVSPLYPFNFKTEGIPRTVSRSSSEGELSSYSRDFLCHETERHRTIEETLLVLPLRMTDDDSTLSAPNTSHKTRTVPPIYRTPLWHETIRLHTRCASIPPRGEAWKERGNSPLAIWREELHSRNTKFSKDTVSLAAKRLVHSEQRAKKRPFMENT